MRLLALLAALALILAVAAWLFVRPPAVPPVSAAASESAVASAPAEKAALETIAAPKRELAAAAPAQPITNSTVIRGRVVHGKDQFPVIGVEVICTKNMPPVRFEGQVVIDDRGSRVLNGLPPSKPEPGSTCTSGPDGSFEFEGLERGALYSLSVRSLGWVLVDPLVNVAPAEEPRTLVLRRIYVASIQAADENGRPLESGCEFLRYVREPSPGECDSVPIRDASEETGALRSYRFASDCELSTLGPFRVLLIAPGYERQDFDFWAFPAGSSAIPTVLRLKRAADLRGTLRLHQECACAKSVCDHLLEGRIDFEPVDGEHKPLSFELSGLVREEVFQEIPAGSWRVRVHALVGSFCFPPADEPPAEIVIGEGQSLFTLPVGKLGAIRWALRGVHDEMPARPVFLSEDSGANKQLWMSLVMRGLEAGVHTFRLSKGVLTSLKGGDWNAINGGFELRVEVTAGETKLATLHVQ